MFGVAVIGCERGVCSLACVTYKRGAFALSIETIHYQIHPRIRSREPRLGPSSLYEMTPSGDADIPLKRVLQCGRNGSIPSSRLTGLIAGLVAGPLRSSGLIACLVALLVGERLVGWSNGGWEFMIGMMGWSDNSVPIFIGGING